MGQGSDGGRIHQLAWLGSGWVHTDVTGATNTPAPPAFFFSDLATVGTGANSDPRIYYLNGAGNIIQLAWVSAQGGWSPVFNLTANTTIPQAFVGSDSATSGGLAVMGSGNSSDPQVFYLSADGHVQHLGWDGSRFVHEDVFGNVTQGSAVNAVVGTKVVAMGSGQNLDPRVFYFRTDGLVGELEWVGHWNAFNASLNQPFPDTGSGLAAVGVGPARDPRVYFVSGDGHVQEVSPGQVTTDVSRAAGSPPAALGSAIAAMATADGNPHVFYLSADGHLQHLALVGHWVGSDVTEQTGQPPSVALGMLAVMGSGTNFDPHVFYVSEGGDVQTAAWVNQAWQPDDVTTRTGAPRALAGNSPRGLGAMGTLSS